MAKLGPKREGPLFSKSLTFNMPPYLWEAVCKRASEERRTISDMMRLILEDALEAPRGD